MITKSKTSCFTIEQIALKIVKMALKKVKQLVL